MSNVEIPKWLEDLPLAPVFYPTDTEFADPIAYISKIEKKASVFGICKIIPPLPKPSKKYVFANLNKSLLKCPELGDGVNLLDTSGNDLESRAVFTTRHQELGQDVKRVKGMVKENPQLGVHKQVWQSGEIYTLDQFESKSKAFAKSMLGLIKHINPLVIETLFWKAASEKPIYVEYANDVPGSGFGEPEGHFRYFHNQRRKRASYKSYRRRTGSSDCKENGIGSENKSCDDKTTVTAVNNDPSMPLETLSKSSTTSTTSSEENGRCLERKSACASNEVEGTAGWKLSNSPWNLQVIARSPGSLTRFMPDDIPGVTSPMVYIGMLFSWFAWHVEDHELHSLNFLHTGSPKTWYAVPGEYAFAFEEAVHTEAYGGSIDRLAALSLLGEKTTLLSPEMMVSSDIPCCRLVQNPGEFVVTFPRAYHVGFSHGFNCGEAANFGTPEWLKVAKEAAVRRAAMNYLPMLSHQQLLYLLTMSFVSRVPRSLLPGARSSRLRDRLKEERELSVKKAFVDDMLKENNILSALLSKNSACNVVIWNPDLLPCANKDSQMASIASSTPEEIVLHTHSEQTSETADKDLLKEMSLCMENLKDLYMDDDISCDFQVDSGTLPCVACGTLGFPFMSVVQPSEKASVELLPLDCPLAEDGSAKDSVSDLPVSRGWNNSSKFLRPRIFCLEHGVQILELLQSRGGANMLVICHSDYQKIKANSAAIVEEIGTLFNHNEVPLESAIQEDLNLIYYAIDDEDHDECGEDWTSKLGINLRYCVKIRKNSPSNKVQHALALGGLFSDKISSEFLDFEWKSKRSRSKIKINRPTPGKPSDGVHINKDILSAKTTIDINVNKDEKLIQYTRRKYKVKIDCSWDESLYQRLTVDEVSVSSCEDLVKNTGEVPKSSCSNTEIGGSDFGLSGVLHEVQVQATEDLSLIYTPLQVTGSLPSANAAVEEVVEQTESQSLERSCECDNVCDVSASGSLDMEHRKINGGIFANEELNAAELSSKCIVTADEKSEMQGECQAMDEATDRTKPSSLHDNDPPVGSTENIVGPKSCFDNEVIPEKSCMNSEVCDLESVTLDDKAKQAFETRVERHGSHVQGPTVSVNAEECSEVPRGSCASEDRSVSLSVEAKVQEEIHSDDVVYRDQNLQELHQLTSATTEEQPPSSRVTQISSQNPIIMCSETEESCSPGNIDGGQEDCTLHEMQSIESAAVYPGSIAEKGRKRRNELEQLDMKLEFNGFVKSPCEGLRSRAGKDITSNSRVDMRKSTPENPVTKKARNSSDGSVSNTEKKEIKRRSYKCDLEGCTMRFNTKAELQLHKDNKCPHEGCRKKFSSHRYAVIHQRVHEDDRPLKCTWKGCNMSFKWAWARTEHLRVHTGEKPYKCKVDGCDKSFRFVSDYSRHRRKTGHYVDTPA